MDIFTVFLNTIPKITLDESVDEFLARFSDPIYKKNVVPIIKKFCLDKEDWTENLPQVIVALIAKSGCTCPVCVWRRKEKLKYRYFYTGRKKFRNFL